MDSDHHLPILRTWFGYLADFNIARTGRNFHDGFQVSHLIVCR